MVPFKTYQQYIYAKGYIYLGLFYCFCIVLIIIVIISYVIDILISAALASAFVSCSMSVPPVRLAVARGCAQGYMIVG